MTAGARSPAGDADADRPPERYGALVLASMTLALVSWPIAFNLGAFEVVFYDDIFRVVVASFVIFAVTLVAPAYTGTRLWVVRVVLASPSLWLALAVAVEGSTGQALTNPVLGAWAALIVVASVPVTLKLLIDSFVPTLSSIRSRRLLAWLVGVIAVVAVAGYLVGRHNDRFLTCDDFKVAGSDQPENCAPG